MISTFISIIWSSCKVIFHREIQLSISEPLWIIWNRLGPDVLKLYFFVISLYSCWRIVESSAICRMFDDPFWLCSCPCITLHIFQVWQVKICFRFFEFLGGPCYADLLFGWLYGTLWLLHLLLLSRPFLMSILCLLSL